MSNPPLINHVPIIYHKVSKKWNDKTITHEKCTIYESCVSNPNNSYTREQLIKVLDKANNMYYAALDRHSIEMLDGAFEKITSTDAPASAPASASASAPAPASSNKKRIVKVNNKKETVQNFNFTIEQFDMLNKEKVFDNTLQNSDIDTKILQSLHELRCPDKDEGAFRPDSLKRLDTKYLSEHIVYLIRMAKCLIDAVEGVSGILHEVSEINKLNFAMHAMSKGPQMYYMCLTDTTFCLYLLPDNYQPIFSELIKNPVIQKAIHRAFK